MKTFHLLLVTFACVTFVGCDRAVSTGNGPVAVIDLDAVAKQLGRDKRIVQMIEERQVSLNSQMMKTQDSLIQQLNQKKVEFGDLSEEEATQLSQLQKQANAILTTTRAQAQSNLTQFQQEVVDRFRAEAKPIAMELAAKKGCRVVLSKNDSVVFAFDEAVDLTAEVAAVMKLKSPVTAAAETQVASTQSADKQAVSSK